MPTYFHPIALEYYTQISFAHIPHSQLRKKGVQSGKKVTEEKKRNNYSSKGVVTIECLTLRHPIN